MPDESAWNRAFGELPDWLRYCAGESNEMARQRNTWAAARARQLEQPSPKRIADAVAKFAKENPGVDLNAVAGQLDRSSEQTAWTKLVAAGLRQWHAMAHKKGERDCLSAWSEWRHAQRDGREAAHIRGLELKLWRHLPKELLLVARDGMITLSQSTQVSQSLREALEDFEVEFAQGQRAKNSLAAPNTTLSGREIKAFIENEADEND